MKAFKYITFALFAGFISLLACPGTSNAQSASMEEITRQAHEAGIDRTLVAELYTRTQKHSTSEQTVITIVRSATEMAENDLPYELIFDKAFEGLTKSVSSQLIETAVIDIRQTTKHAAEIADPWIQKQSYLPSEPTARQSFRKGLIGAISNVMRNNVSAGAVENTLSALSGASFPSEVDSPEIIAAVRILPDMAEFAGNPEAANRFILRLLKGGFTSKEMLKLPMAMRYFQSRNQLPAAAILETVSGQLQQFPASSVIRNLIAGDMANKSLQGKNKIQSRL